MGLAASIAATGAIVFQKQLQNAAVNLSNAPVLGVGQISLNISNMVAPGTMGGGAGVAASDQGNPSMNNYIQGLGVKVTGMSTAFAQGTLKNTDQVLDLAIKGNGFFVINFPDGRRGYTRAGNFAKTVDGRIVTQKGLDVSPGIVIDPQAKDVTINESGEVWVTLQGQAPALVGQLEIALFANPQGLEPGNDSIYFQSDPADVPIISTAGTDGRGLIVQGSVEESPIQPILQLVEAMEANNRHAMMMKIIEADIEQGKQIAQAA